MTNEENIKKEENQTNEEVELNEETTECATETVDTEKELNDRYMRLVAEFDNYKKRTQKEKAQIYTFAAAEVIEAILPFLDNLQRASSISSEHEETKKVIDGIKLIERQFEDILLNLGVKPIEAVGMEFNPEMHNAVMHIDDETVDGENIIVEEFAKGYIYKDKVVRHSTVKVAN